MERNPQSGFTLIEMLLVVIIISTLAAMIVPRFTGRSEEAKVAAARTDIEANLAGALDMYELDHGAYPKTLDDLSAKPTDSGLAKKWKGPYLKKKKALNDPWGNLYQYDMPGRHNEGDYDLFSYGPDGKEGGGDDITNWDGGDGEKKEGQ